MFRNASWKENQKVSVTDHPQKWHNFYKVKFKYNERQEQRGLKNEVNIFFFTTVVRDNDTRLKKHKTSGYNWDWNFTDKITF